MPRAISPHLRCSEQEGQWLNNSTSIDAVHMDQCPYTMSLAAIGGMKHGMPSRDGMLLLHVSVRLESRTTLIDIIATPVMSQRNWVNPPDECSQWKCFHGHLAIALPGAFWDALTSLRKMQRLGKRPWSSRPGFPYPSSYSPIRVLRASNPRIKSVESWLHITVRSV